MNFTGEKFVFSDVDEWMEETGKAYWERFFEPWCVVYSPLLTSLLADPLYYR